MLTGMKALHKVVAVLVLVVGRVLKVTCTGQCPATSVRRSKRRR
jgi:hypothetical protein